jgi:general secretion pathway protein B
MSLILEALRKSEAERQRGRAPGLFVEQVATRRGARAKAPAWAWAVGVLFVATVLVFGWREWTRLSPAAPAPGDVSMETSSAGGMAAAAPGAGGTAAVGAGNAPAMDATAGTAEARRSDAAPGTAPTAGPGPMTAPESSAPAMSAAPVPFAPPPAAPGTASASPASAMPPAADPAAYNATTWPAEPAARTDAAPLPAAQAAPAPFQPPAEALPSLASLDAGTRSQLPPLKLSMHVYAEEPAQRFVILDGRRLGEGASPQAGVVLEEIRRDGLVLSVDGRRLLLARP